MENLPEWQLDPPQPQPCPACGPTLGMEPDPDCPCCEGEGEVTGDRRKKWIDEWR